MMKKKYSLFLLVFASLYVVLPSYFAIEVSTSLPLLTASRILLLLLIIYYIYKSGGKLQLSISKSKEINKILMIFFLLIILVDIVHISEAGTISDIFSILFEGLIVIWIIGKCIRTENVIIQFLKMMIITSGVVAVISMIGSIIGVNFFNYLMTVQRKLNVVDFTRMGLLRPQAGFDHAVHYGLYNALMCIIALFFYEDSKTKNNWIYMICFFLDLAALIFANSRGSLLALVIVLVLKIFNKDSLNRKRLKRYLLMVFLVVLAIGFLALAMPNIFTFIWKVILSIYAAIFNPDMTISGYGQNTQGLLSRTAQLSGITWTIKQNLVWGLGPNAISNGLLQYINPLSNDWYVTDTFDVGYIQIFCEYGVVGSIAFVCLYRMIIRSIFNQKMLRSSRLPLLFRYVFLCYFFGILTVDISGTSKLFWLLLSLLIAYVNIVINNRNDEKLKSFNNINTNGGYENENYDESHG